MRYSISRNPEQEAPTDDELLLVAGKLLDLPDVTLPDGVIEVKFCSDEEMISLNRNHLNINALTDVLAFVMLDIEPESGELIIGCIAVNYDLAQRYADSRAQKEDMSDDKRKRVLASEVLLYVLHGMLHFAGYEDVLEEGRKEMFDIAHRVLEQCGFELISYEESMEE